MGPLLSLCAFVLCLRVFLVTADKSSRKESELVEPVSEAESRIMFDIKEPFKLIEGQTTEIAFVTTLEDANGLRISTQNDGFATFFGFNYELVSSSVDVPQFKYLNNTDKEVVTAFGSFNVTALFVGYSTTTVTVYDANQKVIGNRSLKVGVLLAKQIWTQICSIIFAIALILMFFNMGSTLDLEVIKQIAKKPVGPAIGLVCQYGCMPMIAYFLGLWGFPENNLYRLGLFASGCAPGGGLSNMWTRLLGGSTDLSMAMTFVSTVASIGMVPLWLLTVGQSILGGEYTIPYGKIITGVTIMVFPVFIGVGAQLRFSNMTKTMDRVLHPTCFIGIAVAIGVAFYANTYVFYLLTWRLFLVAFGLSFFGYLAGIILAVLFRRSVKEIIAISIETAVQNNSIGYFFLINSIDRPAGDLAAVISVSVFLLSPPPILIAVAIKNLYESLIKKPKQITPQEANYISRGKLTKNGISKHDNCSKDQVMIMPIGCSPGTLKDNPAQV